MALTAAERSMHSRDWAKLVENCPNEAAHTYGPPGYIAWHEWAERRTKTHTQKRCSGCGLYLIHEPKRKD